ncbi:MAG: VWA domain-containing protein [Deltaproteobacteria bacterium]|nr:VWA domain-containing protein [Deltaproteobacteria bacterium]
MKRTLRVVAALFGAIVVIALGLSWAIATLGSEVLALRWDRPWWLLALLAVPLLLWAGTVGDEARVPRLLVGTVSAARRAVVGWRARLRDVPGVLRAGAVTLIVIALARPQSIAAAETDERRGIDVMVVLDLSLSMRAADLKPTRLAAAKVVIQEFVERRQDDRLGAVVFGREAFLLSAPTFDHVRLAQLIGKMELGVVNGGGTAIGDGLATALAKLRHSQASSRVVVLLTDGDNNAGSMSPEYATGLAKQLGVKIFPIQMGNGDLVDVEAGRDFYGRPVYERVRFPVQPEVLKKIATETGGEFWISTDTEQLRSSMHAILDRLTKTRFEAASGDVVERFPLVLAPAVALVLIEALVRALVLRRFP